MGYAFEARHTNLVSYVLDKSAKAPRSTKQEVTNFVRSLAEPIIDPNETLITGLGGNWQIEIQRMAQKIIRSVEALPDDPFPNSKCTFFLKPLHKYFSEFSLFSLLLVSQDDDRGELEAAKFLQEAARASGPYGLFLKPQGFSENLNFLDPLSVVSTFSKMPTEYPSVVFWTPNKKYGLLINIAEPPGFW